MEILNIHKIEENNIPHVSAPTIVNALSVSSQLYLAPLTLTDYSKANPDIIYLHLKLFQYVPLKDEGFFLKT